MYKKIITYIICIFLLSGCSAFEPSTPLSTEDNQNNQTILEENLFMDYDAGFALGSKIKEIKSLPDKDKSVILVDQESISKQVIESIKFSYNDTPLTPEQHKEKIIDIIRKIAMQAEADRLKIEPTQEEIDAYREQFYNEELLKSNFPYINGYLAGAEITIDDYIQETKFGAYLACKRQALWQQVKPSFEADMQAEAQRRNMRLHDIETEYYKKYGDTLVENAEIQILDKELKKILSR